MTKEEKQINYWANMLNESFNKQTVNEAKMTREQYQELQDKLAAGVVEFNFIKKDGTSRHVIGTLNPRLMPNEETQRRLWAYDNANSTYPGHENDTYDAALQRYHDREGYMPYFWDLENCGYRSFHISRFEGIVNDIPEPQVTQQARNVYTSGRSVDQNRTDVGIVALQAAERENAVNARNNSTIMTVELTIDPALYRNIGTEAGQYICEQICNNIEFVTNARLI